ncbi:putative beta-lysine N-acetyltransferase [Mobilitalea sibirica]|uniref:Putative beta-lysine N-acetyltransferase n=1 Tax=Mobilitalea sibirica TaxID=1462919 RepID=A0A8J7H3S5_9FIRM|nr:putative beta-lysine N-acetyltransferase [Mobilitalea sibirica]MBH1941852.1 putative beta-lysine N-acetyltransferase [Mobilitalea sibirica]
MLLDIPKIETIKTKSGCARIKRDYFNQRIKLVSFTGEIDDVMSQLIDLNKEGSIGKIFAVILKQEIPLYKERGFIIEAKVDQFLKGEAGYFVSRFLTTDRKISLHLPEEEEVLIISREYTKEDYIQPVYEKYTIRDAVIADAEELAVLYDGVFETYPSPMNDPEYIRYAMEHDVMFKVAEQDYQIVSAASADMDPLNNNAEMTDCATLKSHRGHGLMGRLIFELENELKHRNYKVLYSTARSISTGMNVVFAKHSYEYGGRLVNHCHICGQFENMNIWVKVLS